MRTCSPLKQVFVLALCVLTSFEMLPFSFGGAVLPIGKVATSGTVSIEGSIVPTGSVILSGERIAAQQAPVLVMLREGGSVLLSEGGAATFSRNDSQLLIQPESGTMNFNFLPGQNVQIRAGSRNYIAANSHNVGAITMGPNGESAVSMSEGSVSDAAAKTPAPKSQASNKGTLTKGGNTFTVDDAKWVPDSLKNQTLIIGGKKFKIIANTINAIQIEGVFGLATGAYGFAVSAAVVAGGMSAAAAASIAIAGAAGTTGGVVAATRKSD